MGAGYDLGGSERASSGVYMTSQRWFCLPARGGFRRNDFKGVISSRSRILFLLIVLFGVGLAMGVFVFVI